MSRLVIARAAGLAGVLVAGVARAQPAPDPVVEPAPAAVEPAPAAAPATLATAAEDDRSDLGDQAISAQLGLATGGRMTPGGLRISGHYLYQLSGRDWFDGGAHFTFGSSAAGCFRDRADLLVCDHGLSDGSGVEVVAAVRRMLAPQGSFRPYARVGLGIGLARYADDSVSGLTVALHGGGGVRVKVAPSIAVVAEADLGLGFGHFNRDLGNAPYTGLAITAGVEFRLR